MSKKIKAKKKKPVLKSKAKPIAKSSGKSAVKKAAVKRQPAAPAEPAAPARAPVRKIFGAGNTVTIVPMKPAAIVEATPAEAAPTIEQVQPAAPAPKYAWTDLPRWIPAHFAFL